MTLLSNQNNFLPLKKENLKSIAVIGPAGDAAFETGNYYGTPARKVSPLQGLKDALGAGVNVEYEQGAGFVEAADPVDDRTCSRSRAKIRCRHSVSRNEPQGGSRGQRPPGPESAGRPDSS